MPDPAGWVTEHHRVRGKGFTRSQKSWASVHERLASGERRKQPRESAFTFVYLCLPLFTFVYLCLPLLFYIFCFQSINSSHCFNVLMQESWLLTQPVGQGTDQLTWLRSSGIFFCESTKVLVLFSTWPAAGWGRGLWGGRTLGTAATGLVTTGTTGTMGFAFAMFAVAAAGSPLVVVIVKNQHKRQRNAWARREAVMTIESFCGGRLISIWMALPPGHCWSFLWSELVTHVAFDHICILPSHCKREGF